MPSVLCCRIALTKRHLSPEEVFGRGKPSVPSIGAGATALTLTPAGPHSSARTVVVGSPSPFYSCTAHVTGWSRWLRVAAPPRTIRPWKLSSSTGFGHTVAVECVLVRRSGGVPLRGLGFGLAASGSAGAGSYRSSVGAGCCGADAMACTNQRCGWPGNRWGRGPNWATTGVIRPVTEISGRVDVAVHDFTCERAHQVFVDSAFADQARWGAVRCGAAVVDLAGGKPAIRHDQVAAVAGSLVRPVAAQPIPSQHPRWPGETIAGPCSVSWRPRRDPRSRCGRRRPPARW